MWAQSGCRLWLCLSAFIVSTCVGVQDLSGIQDLPALALVLWSCVPAFLPAFLLCLWCVMLEYGSVSRFKAVLEGFAVQMYVCMSLGICVACVAFVRVWS